MTNQTKTAVITAHREARFTQHQWIVQLDDDSEVALPRVFTLPPVGTELELELESYVLPPDIDPHQDERFHVVRIRWSGDMEVHAGEFNALMAEHEDLRANLAHVRGLLDERQQPSGAAPPAADALSALVQRLGSAWDAFRGAALSPPPQGAARPGPQDAPPWAGQVPTAPPGAPRGRQS